MTAKFVTRREVLRTGGRVLVAAGAGLGAHALVGASPAQAVDWSSIWRKKKDAGGYGIVRTLEGEAFVGNSPLRVGNRVASGESVTVAPNSRLILNMSDRSVFQFTGPASLELILTMMREGIIKLIEGALLAVIPFGSRFLASGPTATVGIKGTVFYHEVYRQEQPMLQTMEGPMRAPKQAAEYFCNCNGVVEYQDKRTNKPFFESRVEHHQSFFIDPTRPGKLIEAPMANHTDDEILRLIALQEGEKHDATWIERYRSGQ